MEHDSTAVERIEVKPALMWQPRLLLLAPFLGSLPLSMPNARLVRDVFALDNLIVNYLIVFHIAILIAALGLLISSRTQASTPRRTAHAIARKACTLAYVALFVVFYVLLITGSATEMNVPLIGACQGLTVAPLIIGWIEEYRGDIRNIMLHGSLSCICAILIAWGLSFLGTLLFAIGNVLCIIVGCIPLLLEKNLPVAPDEDDENSTLSSHESKRQSLHDFLSILWMPFLGLLICVLLSSSSEFTIEGTTLRTEFIGGLIASLLAIGVCIIPSKAPLVMIVDLLVTPALIALSIVFGSFQPGDLPFFVGASIVFAPLMFMSLFALSSLEAVVSAGEYNTRFVAGIVLLASNVCALAGITLGRHVPNDVVAPYAWVIACIYFGVVIVNIGLIAWRQVTSRGENSGEDEALANGLAAQNDGAASSEAFWVSCVDELATEHNLTARERELLAYMSRGYGSVYISKALFISDNTARTHIRNIYRKVGVHSREELIALFVEDNSQQTAPRA